MKVLIISFSNNLVNEDSFVPNKMGLTFSCVNECISRLKELGYSEYNEENGREILEKMAEIESRKSAFKNIKSYNDETKV